MLAHLFSEPDDDDLSAECVTGDCSSCTDEAFCACECHEPPEYVDTNRGAGYLELTDLT